jgi:hypothetical protein
VLPAPAPVSPPASSSGKASPPAATPNEVVVTLNMYTRYWAVKCNARDVLFGHLAECPDLVVSIKDLAHPAFYYDVKRYWDAFPAYRPQLFDHARTRALKLHHHVQHIKVVQQLSAKLMARPWLKLTINAANHQEAWTLRLPQPPTLTLEMKEQFAPDGCAQEKAWRLLASLMDLFKVGQ